MHDRIRVVKRELGPLGRNRASINGVGELQDPTKMAFAPSVPRARMPGTEVDR